MNTLEIAEAVEPTGPDIDPVLLNAFQPRRAWKRFGAKILNHGAIMTMRGLQILTNIPLSLTNWPAETLLAACIIEKALHEIGYEGPISACRGDVYFDFTKDHADEFAMRFLFVGDTQLDLRPENGYVIEPDEITDFLFEKLGYTLSLDWAA